jgi:hypothetical protein
MNERECCGGETECEYCSCREKEDCRGVADCGDCVGCD